MKRISYFKQQRLEHLATLCEQVGRFNRSDLVERFRISTPQASIDIRDFLAGRDDVVYDKSNRCYRVSTGEMT